MKEKTAYMNNNMAAIWHGMWHGIASNSMYGMKEERKKSALSYVCEKYGENIAYNMAATAMTASWHENNMKIMAYVYKERKAYVCIIICIILIILIWLY